MAQNCLLCPRECKVDRTKGATGLCGAGDKLKAARFVRHRGEEPAISGSAGSGTIFLSHCSLRCRYCQNYQISFNGEGLNISIESLAQGMLDLQKAGVHNINWVTPSHYLPWLLEGLKLAAINGLNIPLVYNCGGYESTEALRLLDGIVDIYLPDAKYAEPKLAERLSAAYNYPEINRLALAEMWRQVGSLKMDKDGLTYRGLIVRHLVIPGELQNTFAVLNMLKNALGTDVTISLMGQYFPTEKMKNTFYNRTLSAAEYQQATEYMFNLGFANGWVQEELGVEPEYQPNFRKNEEEMN